MKKKTAHKVAADRFSKFISEPMIATALVVLALIALVLSILEFSNVLGLE